MARALDLAGFADVPGDSRIFRPAEGVLRIRVAIDVSLDDLAEAAEAGLDLVVSHHPPAMAIEDVFLDVFDRHETFMTAEGVPTEQARRACREVKAAFRRDRAAERGVPASYAEVDRAAERAGIGLMNVHQPCDELGRRALQGVADGLGPRATVADLVAAFESVPELRRGPESVDVPCGDPGAPLGRTVVVHAAGTNGGYPVARALFAAGVGTVVYIHCDPADAHRLRREGQGSLVTTGHYGSDSVGINPLIDALEARGAEVTCGPKLVRVPGGSGRSA